MIIGFSTKRDRGDKSYIPTKDNIAFLTNTVLYNRIIKL